MLITDFFNFSDFFTAYMRQKRLEGSRVSYRSLSKALGLQSTSTLAMIASGRRYPQDDLLEKLCLKLGLNGEQLTYARFMLGYAKAAKSDEKQFFLEKMNRLRPTQNQEVDISNLELISQWEYLFLICLAGEKNGIPTDLNELSRAIRFRLSPDELRDRLDHLAKLGYLSGSESKGYRSRDKVVATPKKTNSNLVKNLHQQMLKLAGEEIYQQTPDERHFSFAFMTASPKKMQRAKELLDNFRYEFDRAMAEEDEEEPTEVYQFGLQFFPITDLTSKAKGKEDVER